MPTSWTTMTPSVAKHTVIVLQFALYLQTYSAANHIPGMWYPPIGNHGLDQGQKSQSCWEGWEGGRTRVWSPPSPVPHPPKGSHLSDENKTKKKAKARDPCSLKICDTPGCHGQLTFRVRSKSKTGGQLYLNMGGILNST